MKSFCSYYNQGICRSCDLITTDYSAQIRKKEAILLSALKSEGIPELLPTVLSPQKNFRNRAKLVVTGTLEKPVIGLWGEEDLDSGRELTECDLHVKKINAILPLIKEFITLAQLRPYEISSRKGELKGIILFHSECSGETYLRFILRSKESIDRIKKHHALLLSEINHLRCISVNIQPIPHALLEGEEEIFITEDHFINNKIGTINFFLDPKAFVQTNQFIAEKLYSYAAQWIKEAGTKNFMELFCGQGAFSFFAAPFINKGMGIEINSDAVAIARDTATRLHLTHLKFKTADAGRVLDEMIDFSPDLLLVNPPRRGIAETADLILKTKPSRIIYSSCHSESLAVDIKKLRSSYELKRVQIFDMFPHTSHFETLVELKLTTVD
jgi:23S rRNA (uracil747-C5)-methyltransferase